MRDYQESVTIGQTDTRTDRRRTKWSLCAAMLRRRHNKPAGHFDSNHYLSFIFSDFLYFWQ